MLWPSGVAQLVRPDRAGALRMAVDRATSAIDRLRGAATESQAPLAASQMARSRTTPERLQAGHRLRRRALPEQLDVDVAASSAAFDGATYDELAARISAPRPAQAGYGAARCNYAPVSKHDTPDPTSGTNSVPAAGLDLGREHALGVRTPPSASLAGLRIETDPALPRGWRHWRAGSPALF
jgi:hypothetical protein